MKNNPSTAVVVVTCNRLELLKENLRCLKRQTAKADWIIVVNNGSVDGTAEWLATQSEVEVLSQENLGSAGGQYAGLAKACKLGASWIWMMDDDFMPDSGALDALKACATDSEIVYGSVAISNKNEDELCWHTKIFLPGGGVKYCKMLSDFPEQAAVKTEGIGFLGLYIHSSIVAKIGLPKKELFIWADDVEYFRRITQKGGFPMYYVRGSIGRHPPSAYVEKKFLWKTLRVVRAAPEKAYYGFRNNLWIDLHYERPLFAYAILLPKRIALAIVVAVYMESDRRAIRLYFYLMAILHGAIGRLGKL
jgi:GT2 family glycosyltransferase